MIRGMDSADLARRFTYHRPHGDQPARYEQLRRHALTLATLIHTLTPESRERSLAITHLEEAVFWAIAAIARHEPVIHESPPPEGGHPPSDEPHLATRGYGPLATPAEADARDDSDGA